jgi:hypothetical protein
LSCDDGDDEPTPAQTEGPYFTSNSPERASLVENGMAGTRLTITGRVLSTACQPITRAKLDFWQADNGRVLTTQLYFPGEPRNASDGIYSARLDMAIQTPPAAGPRRSPSSSSRKPHPRRRSCASSAHSAHIHASRRTNLFAGLCARRLIRPAPMRHTSTQRVT